MHTLINISNYERTHSSPQSNPLHPHMQLMPPFSNPLSPPVHTAGPRFSSSPTLSSPPLLPLLNSERQRAKKALGELGACQDGAALLTRVSAKEKAGETTERALPSQTAHPTSFEHRLQQLLDLRP